MLDWAGTTVDFGSRAPVVAMQRAFQLAGIPVSEAVVRKPMGMAKPDHIRGILFDADVAERWAATHGRPPTDDDAAGVYERFLTEQIGCVGELSAPIEGCLEAVDACRAMGLKIGSSTGYTRELLAPVAERAAAAGYTPDACVCADDMAPGRPAPWLCFENARRLGVFPMAAVLKVDDTTAGVAAGRNAGAWAVGVVASGNEVGLAPAELDRLDPAARESLFDGARQRLAEAGAHLLIDTIAELPAAVARINERLSDGGRP